jgi:hypothetical protein
MLYQISDGKAGFTLGSTNYEFSDIDSIDYTYSKKNNLTRGASGNNKVGILVKEGLKDADMADIRITDCSVAIYNLLENCFKNGTRINVWFIDNKTGGGFTFKQAVITDKPRQAQIAEGIDALNFMLKVKSFDVVDKIKD